MRPTKPLTSPLPDPAYPSVPDAARRGFLGAVLAGGSLAAAGLLARPRRGRAGPAPAREQQVVVPMKRSYTFRHGNQRLEKIVAQSADAGLIAFLGTASEADGLEKAVVAVLDAHSCVDLGDGKRLAALQVKLGRALASRYQERTRRRALAPTVTLFVGLPVPSCLGQCPVPVPYCRPPAARP